MREVVFTIIAGIASGIISPFIEGSMVSLIRFINNFLGEFIIFTPVLGFCIVGLLAKKSPIILGTGVNAYANENTRISLTDTILKYVSTIVTLGFGGSGGLVSPTLYLGRGISESVYMKRERILSIAFASGMLTYYLGTPLTAALLSVEYLRKDEVSYEDLMPAVLASAISYYNYKALGYKPIFLSIVNINDLPSINTKYVIISFLIAIIFGGIATGIYFLKWIYRKYTENLTMYKKTFFSGLLVSTVGIIFGAKVLGLRVILGENPINFIFGKILATVFTIESMGSSGYFTPLTTVGINLGHIASNFGLPHQIGAVLGISSMLSSMLNIPIAAVIFPIELCGYKALIPAVIGSSVSYMIYKRFRLE
ncbi:chloride channel protein [Thermosipho ferrireducens]|uniref:Chloride channel protein n=1 Tax=Thermosipho ferrireducens TaxID=2571116 RepID=A0ABX7S6L6_9BACT|nr:chloride channel protein [Thermosipho ferrireducens]QTA38232.1 chloride channel protein [Thermosipho ferrireducens]